jgi:hypothetical protein
MQFITLNSISSNSSGSSTLNIIEAALAIGEQTVSRAEKNNKMNIHVSSEPSFYHVTFRPARAPAIDSFLYFPSAALCTALKALRQLH